MQIVIDIPHEIYNLLQITDYIECQDRNLANDILKRIKNGTPLPEHHGRLIDADRLILFSKHIVQYIKRETYYEPKESISLDEINNAPTVLEGVKE